MGDEYNNCWLMGCGLPREAAVHQMIPGQTTPGYHEFMNWQKAEQARAEAGLPATIAARTQYDQPDPIPNESTPVWNLVIQDMLERDHVGRQRYGTPLQIDNGRDMLEDAYAEVLDLAVYLRGAIEEKRRGL